MELLRWQFVEIVAVAFIATILVGLICTYAAGWFRRCPVCGSRITFRTKVWVDSGDDDRLIETILCFSKRCNRESNQPTNTHRARRKGNR